MLVKRFKVSRITVLSSPSSRSETKRSVAAAAAVLHERETESWQRLFDIYEEFIQRSGTCPWIFRKRGQVDISTGFAALAMLHFLQTALFKAEPISFVDRTAWMLIGSVLTLARQKVQANADAGGKCGCCEGSVRGCCSGGRRNTTRTSAPFVPREPGKRISALENVWWGDIVIMDLDYDCIFSGSIFTGFGRKRYILTVSRVEAKSNRAGCSSSNELFFSTMLRISGGKLTLRIDFLHWQIYSQSICKKISHRNVLWKWPPKYVCHWKCVVHLHKETAPPPASAKLSIKFLIMFSVLPLSTQQPASLLSSFHVEIRPLKQRRVPFSTPQAAQGREGDKGPAVYADLALFARFVRVDPAFYPRIVPLPPSHNLLWTRCTNLSLLESTWIPLFYIWNCNLTFEGGIILVLFFVMITCYGVNNVVIGFIEMFSHVQFNWLGL